VEVSIVIMREKRTRGREQFRRHKSLLITLSRFCRIFPLRLRIGLFNCHRSTKGKIGLGLRYVLMKTIAKSLGDNVSIHPGFPLNHNEHWNESSQMT